MLSDPDFVEKKIILVHLNKGDKISFRNDNLILTDKDNKVKFQLSCYSIFAVFIVGGFTLTSGIIERSKRFGFSIVLFNSYFKIYSCISYSLEGNTLLRRKQYTTNKGNEIAKEIIVNKIKNQRQTLVNLRDKSVNDGIKILDEQIAKLNANDYTDYEIMGMEGLSAKVYFKRLYANYDWNGRQPRVKKDSINLLLDIGYTVLFNYIEAVLNIYGFDVYKGNLHKEFYKRKSLVCDIIEPFRPIIDYKIRKMINLNQISNYNFLIYNGQYQLEWKDSSRFILQMLEEIMMYKRAIFRYIQSYYRWVMKDKEIDSFPKVVLVKDDNN